MQLNEAKETLKKAGYILEKTKDEKVADVIIRALTNYGWRYIVSASLPTATKPRLEFINEENGRYLMLRCRTVNQQIWNAYIDDKGIKDDDEDGWSEVKENISYYDILDLFI